MANYRHRITIKSDATTDDTVDPSYTVFLSGIPCNIIPKSGSETYRGKQLEADTNYVIEMRWITGIHEQMVAVNELDSTTYYFVAVKDVDGRQREMWIQATERAV